MIDGGVNLCSKQFENYVGTLIAHAKQSGIRGLISISNSRKEWRQNLSHIEQYTGDNFQIWTTIGIHPHSAKNVRGNDIYQELETYALKPGVIAIGECGLDYDRMFSEKDVQIQVFKEQIDIAGKLDIPLYLHEREAATDFISILHESKQKYPNLRGLIHCFTGTSSEMTEYLDMGFYIGITGWLCDNRRNASLLEAINILPPDRFILETDSPFLTPFSYVRRWDTRRNQPDSIFDISLRLSKILDCDERDVIERSVENCQRLFGVTLPVTSES